MYFMASCKVEILNYHEVPVLLDQVEAELEQDGADDQDVDANV